MWTWWVSRSSSAPVRRSEANTLVQSSNGRWERHIAELVDDQQLASGKLRLKPQEPFLVACLQKLVHERDGRREADGEASLAGGKPEGESHMALAGAAVAERDNVLAAQDVLRARQLQHEHLVKAGQRSEVERVEALHRRKARLPDAPLDHAPLALDQLQLGQSQKIARMVNGFARAVAGDLVVLA